MAEFKKVCDIADLPPGSMKAVMVGHDRIVICSTAKGVYALADECSHDSAPISTGHIDGTEIVCPRHGARFDLETGDVKAPPAIVGIDRYEARIDGNDVLVKID